MSERMFMKFKNLKKIRDWQFRRLIGVKQKTFAIMVEVIRQADERKLHKAISLGVMDPGSLPGMTRPSQSNSIPHEMSCSNRFQKRSILLRIKMLRKTLPAVTKAMVDTARRAGCMNHYLYFFL